MPMKYVSFAFILPNMTSFGFGHVTWGGKIQTVDDILRLEAFIKQNKDGMRDASISILMWRDFEN